MNSLRRRLLLAGALGVVVAAGCAAWLLGEAFSRSAQRSFDRRLDEDLDKLVALAEPDAAGGVRLAREPADERYDRIFSGWYWAVAQGGETRSSRSAWDEAALDAALAASSATRAFGEVDGPRSQHLRVATQRVTFAGANDALAFAVAGDLAPLNAEVRDFRWFAGLAVAAIAAALLAAMGWQVGYGLRPLRGVAATLDRVRAGDEVRFDPASLPAEIAPMAAQVNDLLDDHARRVQRARHAAQDLAHALKTPLSALALESAARSDEYATRVASHAARMQAVIDRQLAGSFGADTRQRTPLRPVLEALAAVMARMHAGRVDIELDADAALSFAGSREDLEEMLGNLLDNACKHASSRVRASARGGAGTLEIHVEDDGPGLEPGDAERALQRGVRLDERVAGSGLGLAIVQAVAAGYRGTLALGRSTLGGVDASLRFAGPAP